VTNVSKTVESATALIASGTCNTVKRSTDEDGSFALVRRCLRILLTRDSREPLPHTYAAIYAACRSIVTVSKMGEGLYGTLRMELEQSVGRLASDLTVAVEAGMMWIVEFVKVCQWFEIHVVCSQFGSRDAVDLVRQALLQSLMTYLDQIYVPSDRNATSIRFVSR
jgi:cullin-4